MKKSDIGTTGALVGIIVGSDSDLVIMKEAVEILESFGVKNELKIVSAHRTVKRMITYSKNAKGRGLQVIIAGAGGSAHLPGMVAAITPLPVLGVPIMSSSSKLHGLDSLLSIVQMPAGVPVATLAVNGAKNAGILACQILGLKDKSIANKIEKYKRNLEVEVLRRAARLEQLGLKKMIESTGSLRK
jgi:5-(carboxyamino)imidazole ribonucleotide mutase